MLKLLTKKDKCEANFKPKELDILLAKIAQIYRIDEIDSVLKPILEEYEINNLGQKTIQEQVINVVRDVTYQQLNFDREFFMEKLNIYIDKALNKLGMHVINVNIRDLVVEENIER